MQRLDEGNILTPSRAGAYIRLKLQLPHNHTYQILYDKYQARLFRIWVIHGFLWQPVTAEIDIRPYLDSAVVRVDIYDQFSSFPQIARYLIGRLTMWFSWIL